MKIRNITGAFHWRILLFFVMAGIGFYWLRWADLRMDGIFRESLLAESQEIAWSVNRQNIRELTFSEEDRDKPEFKIISDQLRAYNNVRNFGVIQTVARRDDKLIFGPGSIDDNYPIASPTGMVYQKPPDELIEVFNERTAKTAGPFRNEYGRFVSAFAPVVDYHSGEILAVIAIDIEADDWMAEVSKAGNAPLIVVMVFLGIYIAGMAGLEWRNRIPRERQGKLIYLEAVIIMILGFLVTGVIASVTQNMQNQSRYNSFSALARARGGLVREEFRDLDTYLAGTKRLFGASEFVDRWEFREYYEPIPATRTIQGLFWAPEITSEEITETVERARSEEEEVLADYFIWKWDENKERQNVESRDYHYPILYAEPQAENRYLMGLDLGSVPDFRELIQEADRRGITIAADPRELISLNGAPPKIILILRAESRNQKGYIIAYLQVNTLLEHAIVQPGGGKAGISAALCSIKPNGSSMTLASWPEEIPVSPGCFWKNINSIGVMIPIYQFGQSYSVMLMYPSSQWLAANRVTGGIWAVITGIIITGLFSTFVAFVINRRNHLETQVQERARQLSDSELSFRTLADSGQALIWTSGLDKKCDYFNKPWLHFTGRSIEEEMGYGWTEGVHPEDLGNCIDIYTNAFDRREPFSMIYRLRRHDGEYRWVQDDGTPRYDSQGNFAGYIGHCLDVTPKINAHDALAESEAQLKEAQEIAGLGRWELEIETGKLKWSESVYRIMGIDPNITDLKYEDFLQIIIAEDRDIVNRAYTESLRSGEKYEVEHRILTSNDEIKWIYETCRHEYDKEDKPVRSVGIVQDITERKRIEDEMDVLEEQLRLQQRLEVVGTLAAGVAHDFNNLLTGITGLARFAYETSPEDSPTHEDMHELLKLADRAADLTRQLLAFSRKQTLEIEIININNLIEELIKMLKRLLGEHIDLVFEPASDLKNVKADRGQIEQIFMNLVINARDAMPDGGKLTIETENVELDDSYARSHIETKPGHYVMLAVTDTGTGMDEDTKRRLFEPFFTTKGLGKGTGLGLATVHGIVKQHEGSIWVYSELGKGTTFKIYLPAVEGAENVTESSERPMDINTSESGTILVVEDNNTVRDMAARILESVGYRVWIASTPSEAESVLNEHEDAIDLMLTDVILPERSGKALYEKAIKKHKGLRVVYMSGYTGNAIEHQGVLDPGVPFVQKPFTPESLLKKVRNVLRGSLDGK